MRKGDMILRMMAAMLALAMTPTVPRAQPESSQPAQNGARELMSTTMARADSVVKAQGGPWAGKAEVYLTWDAPHGARRAKAEKRAACADSTGADTLYLAFKPGRPAPSFNGMTATLRFHPAAGDTLRSWWHYERTGAHAGAITVDFGPDPSIPYRQPWGGKGTGNARLERDREGLQLRMVYAVPLGAGLGSLVPDSVYTLARVILRHAAGLSGCAEPVCVEWAVATLAFGLKDEPRVQRGERFASWNSPGGAVCTPHRKRLEAWKPRGAAAK